MAITVYSPAGADVADEEVMLRKDTLADPVMQEILIRVVSCLCSVGDPNNCLMIGNVL